MVYLYVYIYGGQFQIQLFDYDEVIGNNSVHAGTAKDEFTAERRSIANRPTCLHVTYVTLVQNMPHPSTLFRTTFDWRHEFWSCIHYLLAAGSDQSDIQHVWCTGWVIPVGGIPPISCVLSERTIASLPRSLTHFSECHDHIGSIPWCASVNKHHLKIATWLSHLIRDQDKSVTTRLHSIDIS